MDLVKHGSQLARLVDLSIMNISFISDWIKFIFFAYIETAMKGRIHDSMSV